MLEHALKRLRFSLALLALVTGVIACPVTALAVDSDLDGFDDSVDPLCLNPKIAAGSSHTLGLKADGIVVAVGYNGSGQLSVSTWDSIIDVKGGSGHTVALRIDGTLRALKLEPLSGEDTRRMVQEALPPHLFEKFEKEGELDTSVQLDGSARFRVNVFQQADGLAAVLRVISAEIPPPEAIGLDEVIVRLTDLPRGLVLVTGPTGSGKSTTLASLVNLINGNRQDHILTIEDPIEYVYPRLSCVVSQREVGTHASSFREALKRAMRQDPNVILVGEMRDLDTISAALTLAETGHLVFSTLHTTDAPQTVDRVIDVFPPHQQQQVKIQLAGTLRAVVSQQLVPRSDGQGRVAAREVLIVNPGVSNLIREGKTHQIYSAIQMGGKLGMRTLDADLARLVSTGAITSEAAIAKASDPAWLAKLLSGGRS
jgi:twitching motility protein PilT